MEKEIIVLIIIISGIAGISLGSVIPAILAEGHQKETEEVKEKPVIAYTDFTLLVSMRGNICEECHLSGKKFIPQAYSVKDHVAGGAYCLECHKISHEKHPVNESVTCPECHGYTIPKIPSPGDAKSVCGNCHAFPDALLPSYGNLITVHLPRGVGCVSCHINCAKCHEQSLENEKWDKRINHFNTLLATYK